MSNGFTSVFISALSLGSSSLAQTERHRKLAVWFASHDQDVFGSGTVGFDLSQLPWRAETFEDDRAFVLASVEAAKAKTGWSRLSYTPREDRVLDHLERLKELVAAFDICHAAADAKSTSALGGWPDSYESCREHGVYLHVGGCVVCND